MLHVKYQWLTFLSFFIWKLGSLKSLCLCYKYWNFHRIVVFTLTYVCMHTHQCIHTEAMFWLYLHCWCGSWGCIHWTKCCRKKLLILTIAGVKSETQTSYRLHMWSQAMSRTRTHCLGCPLHPVKDQKGQAGFGGAGQPLRNFSLLGPSNLYL